MPLQSLHPYYMRSSVQILDSRSTYFSSYPGYSYLCNNQYPVNDPISAPLFANCIDLCWHDQNCYYLTYDTQALQCSIIDIPNYDPSKDGHPDSYLDSSAISAKRHNY